MRYDIAEILQEAGYIVLEAASGEEAIAVCNSNIPIDVVFTDVNLGGSANGWDVGKWFRIQRPAVPVLYTSGDVIDSQRCVTGSTFVAKPYQHIDILSACRRLRKYWPLRAGSEHAGGSRPDCEVRHGPHF
jgi:CheY-like chemotaxis protein